MSIDVHVPSMWKTSLVSSHLVRQFSLSKVFQLSQNGSLLKHGGTHTSQHPREFLSSNSAEDQCYLIVNHSVRRQPTNVCVCVCVCVWMYNNLTLYLCLTFFNTWYELIFSGYKVNVERASSLHFDLGCVFVSDVRYALEKSFVLPFTRLVVEL